jgi:hypothetical protein
MPIGGPRTKGQRDPNSKSSQILDYFRKEVAHKVASPRDAYQHLQNKFQVTPPLIYSLKPDFLKIMNEIKGPLPADSVGSRNNGASERALEYFRKHLAGRVQRPQDGFREIAEQTGISRTTLYRPETIRQMEQAIREAQAPIPAGAVEADDPRLPEERGEENLLSIPTDGLSDAQKGAFSRLVNAYVGATMTLQNKEHEIVNIRGQNILLVKKLNLHKSIIDKLMEAV